MEFVPIPLELAKEVVAEVVKETAKTAEGVTQFGKLDKVFEDEKVDFGKISTGDDGGLISFGSLANGAFKGDKNYLKWKDGIDLGEVKEEWIEKLANEISAIYGNDHLTATAKYIDFRGGMLRRFNNAGMRYYIGELIYDPKYLRENGNAYGMDNILGTIAHEVGHRVVYNIGLAEKITPYENEACADYIAGLTTRLCKFNGSHKLSWYNTNPIRSADDVHPGKFVRIESFIRGYDRIDRGAEATTLKTFEEFSPYDMEGIYKDPELMRKVLYEDVINPLRNGEIKKV